MIYKTLHRKLKIEQHEEPGVNSGVLEETAVPALLVILDDIVSWWSMENNVL